jgi:phospholipase DDHD2
MFLTVRGVDNISTDFKFPTCKGFFNIFHPYDPIAYRIEPLIKPDIQVEPVLMPHHLGRKRMHLELREGLTKVGGDLKQKMMEKLKFTWSSLQDFANYHKTDGDADQAHANPEESGVDVTENTENATSIDELNIKIGNLNHGGRRVDYVLQERPIESFNEYLFALTSHGSYWSSEDTLMLVVKEVYSNREITPDTLQQPSGIAAFEQHSMSIAHAAASTISSTFSFFKSSLLKPNSNLNS